MKKAAQYPCKHLKHLNGCNPACCYCCCGCCCCAGEYAGDSVAVKLLPIGSVFAEDSRKEACLALCLHHPNIVSGVIDCALVADELPVHVLRVEMCTYHHVSFKSYNPASYDQKHVFLCSRWFVWWLCTWLSEVVDKPYLALMRGAKCKYICYASRPTICNQHVFLH
jgi:hypothetical protein